MMRSIFVLFSIALCIGICAGSATDKANSTSYTLDKSKTYTEDKEITINFNSPYSESSG